MRRLKISGIFDLYQQVRDIVSSPQLGYAELDALVAQLVDMDLRRGAGSRLWIRGCRLARCRTILLQRPRRVLTGLRILLKLDVAEGNLLRR